MTGAVHLLYFDLFFFPFCVSVLTAPPPRRRCWDFGKVMTKGGGGDVLEDSPTTPPPFPLPPSSPRKKLLWFGFFFFSGDFLRNWRIWRED